MSCNSSFAPRPRRVNALVLVAGLIGVTTLAAFLLVRYVPKTPNEQVSASDLPPLTTSWHIDVSCDGPQHFGGHFTPSQILFIPAGATFRVAAEPPGACGAFIEDSATVNWGADGGELNPAIRTADHWHQKCLAPKQPGRYRLRWQHAADSAVLTSEIRTARGFVTVANSHQPCSTLDVLVLAQAELHTRNGRTNSKVNGKAIGSYLEPTQSSARRVRENAQFYQPPRYFVQLKPNTVDMPLGPDFSLGQLIAFKNYRGSDGKKVYTTERHTDVFPPRPELIAKLVKLRERLQQKGVKVTRFWLTSAFRTPEYNRSIGGAAYSRHCFGDAVDLLIDEDGDNRMDDLNGDGRIDRKDGIIIGNACRELELEGAVVPGGIGVYEWDSDDSVRSHVHIDCRGYVSRWGQDGAGRYKKSFTWWPKAEFQEEESCE